MVILRPRSPSVIPSLLGRLSSEDAIKAVYYRDNSACRPGIIGELVHSIFKALQKVVSGEKQSRS